MTAASATGSDFKSKATYSVNKHVRHIYNRPKIDKAAREEKTHKRKIEIKETAKKKKHTK